MLFTRFIIFSWAVLACSSSGAQDTAKQIKSTLDKGLPPQMSVSQVEENILKDVHQVELVNGSFLYIINEGKHFISGDLYSIDDEGFTNLTEQNARAPGRLQAVQGIRKSDMIIFPPDGEKRAAITVFTDVDCSYCRLFHQEVPKLNNEGVEVRYLAFPRSGPESESAGKMASAWCAGNKSDRQDAISRLKRGESLPARHCKNPVADQYETGVEVGVRGTPTIIFEDGTMLPSYLPAEKLLDWLDL